MKLRRNKCCSEFRPFSASWIYLTTPLYYATPGKTSADSLKIVVCAAHQTRAHCTPWLVRFAVRTPWLVHIAQCAQLQCARFRTQLSCALVHRAQPSAQPSSQPTKFLLRKQSNIQISSQTISQANQTFGTLKYLISNWTEFQTDKFMENALRH